MNASGPAILIQSRIERYRHPLMEGPVSSPKLPGLSVPGATCHFWKDVQRCWTLESDARSRLLLMTLRNIHAITHLASQSHLTACSNVTILSESGRLPHCRLATDGIRGNG